MSSPPTKVVCEWGFVLQENKTRAAVYLCIYDDVFQPRKIFSLFFFYPRVSLLPYSPFMCTSWISFYFSTGKPRYMRGSAALPPLSFSLSLCSYIIIYVQRLLPKWLAYCDSRL